MLASLTNNYIQQPHSYSRPPLGDAEMVGEGGLGEWVSKILGTDCTVGTSLKEMVEDGIDGKVGSAGSGNRSWLVIWEKRQGRSLAVVFLVSAVEGAGEGYQTGSEQNSEKEEDVNVFVMSFLS